MRPATVKFLAVVLLFAQVAMALTPGRMICVPVGTCDLHPVCGTLTGTETREHDDHRSSDEHCDSHHDHGPLDLLAPDHEPCGCHVHLPVPDDDRTPGKPRTDGPDLRVVFVPLVFATVVHADDEQPRVPAARLRPPDFSVTAQVLALKSTRLLI